MTAAATNTNSNINNSRRRGQGQRQRRRGGRQTTTTPSNVANGSTALDQVLTAARRGAEKGQASARCAAHRGRPTQAKNRKDPISRRRTRRGRRGRQQPASASAPVSSSSSVLHKDEMEANAAASTPRAPRRRGAPRAPSPTAPELQSVSASSIHRGWKQPLGSLIRWYVHRRTTPLTSELQASVSAATTTTAAPCTIRQAEGEIERLYFQSQCSVPRTRLLIVQALAVLDPPPKSTPITSSTSPRSLTTISPLSAGRSGAAHAPSPTSAVHTTNNSNCWVELNMVIGLDQLDADLQARLLGTNCSNTATATTGAATTNTTAPPGTTTITALYSLSPDNHGILLPTMTGPGEGPAHCDQTWRYAVVPDWAVGRSYYLSVVNRSPIPLAAKITVDDHTTGIVARNAPIPPYTTRTIRPDQHRYYAKHVWRVARATRIPLGVVVLAPTTENEARGPSHMETGDNEATAEDNIVAMAIDDDDKATKDVMNDHEPTSESALTIDTTTTDGTTDHTKHSNQSFYPALDPTYTFERDGHTHRATEMAALQAIPVYKEWEKTVNAKWACIHAQFSVAVPHRRRFAPRKHQSYHDKHNNNAADQALPTAVPIRDARATERAVLATEYTIDTAAAVAANNHHGNRTVPGVSRVRMERISGLNDQADWKGDPVFDCQLFYRAERHLLGTNDEISMDSTEEELQENSMDGDGVTIKDTPENAEVSLEDFRAAKLTQLQQLHNDANFQTAMVAKEDPEQVAHMLQTATRGMRQAFCTKDIDAHLQTYFAWHQSKICAPSSSTVVDSLTV